MKTWKLVLKICLSMLGIGFLGYVLLISFLLFGPKLKSYIDRTSFESVQWKAHLEDKDPIKIKMVDDLFSRHQLIGMRVDEVEEILGKPPQTNYFKDYDYVYWLGPERSTFSIDSEWLGLKFKDGIVFKADILRD